MTKRQKRPELALDFASDAISLFARSGSGEWEMVKAAIPGSEDFSGQIDALRVEALVRDRSKRPVTLWLPDEQVLQKSLLLTSKGKDALHQEAVRRLAEDTNYSVGELTVALAPTIKGQPTLVLGVLQQTLREARTYAEDWGFKAGRVSTRTAGEKFGPDGPAFELPKSAARRAGASFGRNLAAAASVLVAVGAGYTIYQQMQPILVSPVDIRSSGPEQSTFIVVTDRLDQFSRPMSVVRSFQPDALALPSVRVSSAQETTKRLSDYALASEVKSPPVLKEPAPAKSLSVGGTEIAPELERPGRLAQTNPLTERPDIRTARRAVATIRSESRQQAAEVSAEVSARDPFVDEMASEGTHDPDLREADERPVATTGSFDASDVTDRQDQQIAPAVDPSAAEGGVNADIADNLATEDETSDAPSDLAPPVFEGLPKARPESVEQIALSTISETAEAVSAGDVAPQSEADIAGAADEEAEISAEDRLDDSALAAVTAPQPSKRPRTLQRISKTTRVKRLAPILSSAPTSVRSAAKQSGLALDQTSLIGVIDANSGRKALLRKQDGSFLRVARGDVVDGWRVSDIGRDAMRLTRKGQNRTLLLVSR